MFQTKHLGVKLFPYVKKPLSFVAINFIRCYPLYLKRCIIAKYEHLERRVLFSDFLPLFCWFQVDVKEMYRGMSFELLFSIIFLCQEILDARQQRSQRREELASRRSHASLERMRILSQLAYDPNGRLL